MKRSLFLFLIVFLNVNAIAFSQKVTLKLGEVSIYKALKKISNQTHVDFFYSDIELDVTRIVNVNFENVGLLDVVSSLVGKDYQVQEEGDGLILIMPIAGSEILQDIITITGVVTDENGEPLPGVNIFIKGENRGGVTNINGEYKIIAEADAILVFSFLGFIPQEIQVNARAIINIQLEPDISELQEVVITGIVERKKESYTGAINTVTAGELKEIGNQNIIQSIKTLDPSFIVLENTQLGSNPNVLPTIEVRGKTSVTTSTLRDEFGTDPNSPLFILDGFETDLRTIVDLDMNRVTSITILKDAASTALYGAKAANGVVVVETKKPTAGALRLSYTGDFSVDIPDLTDYNLMNAEEKLEFEKLSGRWDYYSVDPRGQVSLDSIYNAHLAEVRRGVNTYWLDKPLQTGFSQRHSIYTDGGSETLRFGAGLNYKHTAGVMKGSGRESWGGNVDLTYRKGKLNVSNRLYVNGFSADESPYGSFTKFAQANPYYKLTNEEGEITRYLDNVNISGVLSYNMPNPLYSATLNNENHTQGFDIQNSLQAIWTINSSWRVQSSVQLRKGINTQEIFRSPEDVMFDNRNEFERGSYTNSRLDNFSYFANLMLVYAKVFDGKHAITANFRTDIEETKKKSFSTVAVGFPSGAVGNPSFAFGYQSDAKPSYVSTVYRRNNVLASVNYSFNERYLLDATFRLDGSTAFGSNKRYSPFWAVGIGWNLHNEFGFNSRTVNFLKLRANIGSTGNQNFGSVASVSVYGFNSQTNIFGQGVQLLTLANPNLEWQNTLQSNIGLDARLFNNRLSASLEVYNKKTDPLIVGIDLPSSTGVLGYPLNVGYLEVKGIETILKYSPINDVQNRVIWTLGLTASAYASEYGGFNNTVESLNEGEVENNSLIRFRDGFSPDDIWAVPSLGIDPATGSEVFLKANGQTTFTYDFEDETVVGNSRPTMEGIISSNLNYKGFLLGINLRYRFGGDLFNSAVYEKVENIGRDEIAYNQDRRALLNRWQQPGDDAQFKSISVTATTPISSRFVQAEDVIIGESLNIGYQVSGKPWLDNLGLKNLRFNAYMNDIFRISSVQAERGIAYPFARSVSFSINASF